MQTTTQAATLDKAMMELEDASSLVKSVIRDLYALVDSAKAQIHHTPEHMPGFKLIESDGNTVSLLNTAVFLFEDWGAMIEEKLGHAKQALEAAMPSTKVAA